MKIVTLKGCDRCSSLKRELEKLNIFYKEISCEENEDFCDELEVITDSCDYPMLIDVNNRLIYITSDYENLKKVNQKKDEYVLKPCISVQQIVQIIKK